MKMTPQHYATLLEAIRPLAPKLAAHRAFIVSEGKAKDVDMRLRWDALNAVKIDGKPSCFFLSDTLYRAGLNDTHIDTALRSIVSELCPTL